MLPIGRHLGTLLGLLVVGICFDGLLIGSPQGGESAKEVSLHVRFTNPDGQSIRNLSADEIRVFAGSTELPVRRLLAPSEPFHVGLLLDVSPSVHEMVDVIQSETSRFFYSLPEDSEGMLLTFDTQTYVDCDWTTDRKLMDEAIFELGLHKPGNSSILFEALVVALEKKYAGRGPRQALIVLSDGVEIGSDGVSDKESLEVTRQAGVLLFVVQSDSREHYRRLYGDPTAYDPTIMTEPPGSTGTDVGGIFVGTGRPSGRDVAEYKVQRTFKRANEYMRSLSNAGRGPYSFLVTFSDLEKVYREILGDLSDVYTVVVTASRQNDQFHQVRLTSVRDGVTAVPLTRGYW